MSEEVFFLLRIVLLVIFIIITSVGLYIQLIPTQISEEREELSREESEMSYKGPMDGCGGMVCT